MLGFFWNGPKNTSSLPDSFHMQDQTWIFCVAEVKLLLFLWRNDNITEFFWRQNPQTFQMSKSKINLKIFFKNVELGMK